MSNTFLKFIFSKNLRDLMHINNVSQKDLMDILNLPSATISSWVNGKRFPRMDKIQELADYFNVSKSVLIEGEIIPDITKSIQDTRDSILDGFPKTRQEAIEWKKKILLEQYCKLNNAGRNKAIELLEDLTYISKYTEPDVEPPILNVAHVRKDVEVTEEDRQHDEDIMDDDSW